MKVLFYDIDNLELEYFLDNSINLVEAKFFKTSLNSNTFIPDEFKDTEGLSVFVQSELSKEVLNNFPDLKFIFLRCTGYSNVDINYCKLRNIKVFNVPEYSSYSVSEFVFGLILNVSRNILKSNNDLKKGIIEKEALTGVELNSKTIGIIGIGSIGKKVADIAKGFNMKVIVFDINKNKDYNFVSMDNLLKNSDFIVICCPLTPTTKHLINHNSFLKMKKNAFIINVSRGEIIDTKSLYDAIQQEKIKGAGLDTVECEETLCKLYKNCTKDDNIKSNCSKKYLFNSKLLKNDNVIITPHIAYNTLEARKRAVKITLENIKSSFDTNSSPKNLILI